MLRDEYNRLMSLFSQSAEGKKVNLDEVFRESVSFFEHLTHQLKTGTQDEKTEALMMMSELYAQMQIQTKKISQTSGLTEDQLAAYADNPANFTPEQWQMMQESKQKMREVGKDLTKTVSAVVPAQNKPALPPHSQAGEKKPSGKRPSVKRDQWMRS